MRVIRGERDGRDGRNRGFLGRGFLGQLMYVIVKADDDDPVCI